MLTEKDYCDYDTCVALKELGYEVAEYKGYYVTKCGKVFNRYGRELKPSLNKGGYKFLSLSYKGKTKTNMLHRMLAECFIPNPNNYPQINHKDGNKQNNDLSNLEWCTVSQNVQHAWDTGLAKTPEKPVVCLETGKVYKSARFAADTLKYRSPSAITACCLGKRRTAYKGCHWRYYLPKNYVKDLIELGFDKYPKDNSEDELTCYLALACKWLREGKKIEVGATFCFLEKQRWFWYCKRLSNANNDTSRESYSSYEEALLKGIKEAVKILKEKNDGN